MSRRYFFLIVLPAVLTFLLGGFFVARAETTSTGFSVGFTVPSGAGGGGGGGGPGVPNPPPSAPAISNVASSTNFTSAVITWDATSQGGIGAASFVYGVNTKYGSSGQITGSYKVDVSNLICQKY